MKSQTFATRDKALKVAIAGSVFSNRRLAKRLRIHESRLSRIVNGRVSATARECARIAQTLGMSPSDLFEVSA